MTNFSNLNQLPHWLISGQFQRSGYINNLNYDPCGLFVVRRRVSTNLSDSSTISAAHMNAILQQLQLKTTRSSTAKNYYNIWKLFNKFIVRLDCKPKTWERRIALYGAYLVDNKVQSATLKSYFSAIKKILATCIGYELKEDNLLLNTLAKSCRLINDKVHT